jgi:rhomboid family GlyGly-CTERM serine protease
MQYQHSAIEKGEWWRLFTAHLTHLGWKHLMMNLIGLWLIWKLLLTQHSIYMCFSALSILMLFTSAGLLLFSPEISWYRGLSGILHGLLCWSLLHQWCKKKTYHSESQDVPDPSLRETFEPASILLFLIGVKLIWEQWQGPIPGSESVAQGRVIVDAHLYGAISGVLLWSIEQIIVTLQHEKHK